MLAALAVPFFLPGAAHAQFGTLQGTGMMGQGVRFSTVAMGDQAGVDRPGLYRFYDEATFRNHWNRNHLVGQYPPKIDWTADQVIVLHLGRRNTGGYGINIGAMDKLANGGVRITAVETTPPAGSVTTQALTSPFLVLAVDRMVPSFDLAWTKAPLGGFSSVPKGATVISSGGTVTVISPLIGPCATWGGDYYSQCEGPDIGWIASDADLYRYNQSYLGDISAIRPGFDWNSERLLAVHLGTRTSAVAIEMVSFERRGNRGVLKLAEVPARGFRARPGRTISPFLLTRVSREVGRVDVEWVKPNGEKLDPKTDDGKPGNDGTGG